MRLRKNNVGDVGSSFCIQSPLLQDTPTSPAFEAIKDIYRVKRRFIHKRSKPSSLEKIKYKDLMKIMNDPFESIQDIDQLITELAQNEED